MCVCANVPAYADLYLMNSTTLCNPENLCWTVATPPTITAHHIRRCGVRFGPLCEPHFSSVRLPVAGAYLKLDDPPLSPPLAPVVTFFALRRRRRQRRCHTNHTYNKQFAFIHYTCIRRHYSGGPAVAVVATRTRTRSHAHQ